jgi:preprotein translocase subunit SecE
MNKLREFFGKIRTFVEEVVTETRKSDWPERRELTESTTVVIVMVLLFAAFVFVGDTVLAFFLKMIVPSA